MSLYFSAAVVAILIFGMIFELHSSILALVVLFNASGIYFLRLTTISVICNQMAILISLSSCNIMLAVFWMGDLLFMRFKARETNFFYRWWPFLGGQYLVWYSMIIMLTIDRFIGCNFPLQHKIFIRRKFIFRAIGSVWLLGLLFAVVGSCIGYSSLRKSMNYYFWPILDFLCLLLFLLTYGSILCVLARRRFVLQSTRNSHQSQFILTVTALLICFLTLEAIPSIVYAMLGLRSDTFDTTLSALYKINLLCDPLIYIFLQGKVRNIANIKLRPLYTLVFLKRSSRSYAVRKQIVLHSECKGTVFRNVSRINCDREVTEI